MKVTVLRNTARGLSAYVPKKDLEEPVVAKEKEDLWGGTITPPTAGCWRCRNAARPACPSPSRHAR